MALGSSTRRCLPRPSISAMLAPRAWQALVGIQPHEKQQGCGTACHETARTRQPWA